MSERLRVGFAGLGAIGRPIAVHLARRHDLSVWNRTPVRAEAFAREHGARAVPTPRELARQSELLLTCLPNTPEVEAVLGGPDGLEAGFSAGAMLVDLTSGVPGGSRTIADRLRGLGVAFADAPVSGGTAGAEAGTLTIMVGAEPADFERARAVLETFGRTIVHVGPVGAGHALKALHNALIAVHLCALGEALTGLARAGVAPRTALEVINAANGRSFVSERLVPERVLTRAWPKTFRLALLDKDVRIASDLLTGMGLGHPIIAAASGQLGEARAELGEEADHVELIKRYERLAGVELAG